MDGINLSCILKKVKGRGKMSEKEEQLEAKKVGAGKSRGGKWFELNVDKCYENINIF